MSDQSLDDKNTVPHRLVGKIQVNAPFAMLRASLIDVFIAHGLNPEIAVDAQALDRFTPSEFEAIAVRLHEHDLVCTLHGPFVDLSPGSSDPAVRALTKRRFEQLLELLPVFKPKTVVCHAGFDWKRYGYFKEVWLEHSVELWSWLGSRIEAEGARLMLENVYEQHPDEMLMLLEKLENQKVGFCLDIGHQTAFSRASLEIWIHVLAPYLGQLHLHDNNGRKDQHLALGRGCINFKALFNMLQNHTSTPPVATLECHRKEDLWPSYEYLARYWPW